MIIIFGGEDYSLLQWWNPFDYPFSNVLYPFVGSQQKCLVGLVFLFLFYCFCCHQKQFSSEFGVSPFQLSFPGVYRSPGTPDFLDSFP